MVSNLMILAASLYLLLTRGATSWLALTASAALMGLFWQQSGWHAHDYLHHQVFKNRAVNRYMGLLIGNVFQGFSVHWWTTKHNTHHATPNETSNGHAVDPDIDTLPLLAWDKDMLAQVTDPGFRAMLRLQHWLFFPLLLFARMVWAEQSVEILVRARNVMDRRKW